MSVSQAESVLYYDGLFTACAFGFWNSSVCVRGRVVGSCEALGLPCLDPVGMERWTGSVGDGVYKEFVVDFDGFFLSLSLQVCLFVRNSLHTSFLSSRPRSIPSRSK